MDLDVWACPVCLSRLAETPEGLRCTAEGRRFSRRGDLPVLLRPEEEHLLADADRYAAAWRQEAWTPSHEELLRLPFIRQSQWKQKARSLEAVQRILGTPNGRTVADVGAGTGWLSYRLAEAGFRCFATDLSADSAVGLGASNAFNGTRGRFERAIASLTRWPFRSGSIDIAICNASLHYLRDVRPAVREAARTVRPGGLFVVMNEPVHRDPASAERAARDFQRHLRELGGAGALIEQHRHFVASELESDLRSEFSRVTRHDPDYGPWFRLSRAAKRVLLRMELASFPIYVARREI